MSSSIGFVNGVLNSEIEQIGAHRLGISYDSGTFNIIGANGLDLSINNPGYVTLSSDSNPGQLKNYIITENQSFSDASGTSDIIGNLFGFTTSIAVSVDVPFFLYAVANSAESTVTFMISRVPHATKAPLAANIGTPASAVADIQSAFFAFSSVTVADYASQPCICIGSFRMQMDGSDDWTVQTLASNDGIGRYNEETKFTIPLGQFGANAGTLTRNNGGTAAAFSQVNGNYYVKKNGICELGIRNAVDDGADGAGAVTAQVICPFITELNITGISGFPISAQYTLPAAIPFTVTGILSGTGNYIYLYQTGASAFVTWSQFTNGTRSIIAYGSHPISLTL